MTTATHRFQALDSLRGLCALMVVLFHLPVASHLREVPLTQHGYLFVDFFFVLSGFVMAHSYGGRIANGRDALRFMGRRIGRVWPLHVIILLAFVGIELARLAYQFDPVTPFAKDRIPEAIVSNLFLVQAFGLHDSLTWNGPAWSISVELGAYAVFALVLIAAPRRFVWIAVAIAVVCALIVVNFAPRWMNTTYNYGWARALYGFFVGCLVHRLWLLKPAPWPVALQIASTLAALVFIWFVTGPLTVLAPLFFAVCVWSYARETGPVVEALRVRLMLALGTWSYSIYMNHMLVIVLTMIWARKQPGLVPERAIDLGSVWLNDLVMLAVLGVIVGLSALTYRFIETPGRRLANRWIDRRAQRTDSEVPAYVRAG
jgi:peptidoglycan/LPS O-acetylase OafA/YrhL